MPPRTSAHRHAAALLAAVPLLVATLGAPAIAGAPEPARRCHRSALLLGDSNMYGALGHALTRPLRARGYEVERVGKPGSGLARPDFYDWPTETERMVAERDPDLVVIILGGNDIQRLRDHSGEYGTAVRWDDEARWVATYAARVRALAQAMDQPRANPASPPRRIFFLSPTNRRPPKNRARVQRVWAVQRQTLATYEGWTSPWGVQWIDAFAASSAPSGRCLARGPDRTGHTARYRQGDGIHLTRAGAEALRDRIWATLVRGDGCNPP